MINIDQLKEQLEQLIQKTNDELLLKWYAYTISIVNQAAEMSPVFLLSRSAADETTDRYRSFAKITPFGFNLMTNGYKMITRKFLKHSIVFGIIA